MSQPLHTASTWFLSLGSALLLIAAFPPCDQAWAAWVALVPWLLLLRGVGPRAAFGWSWLIGVLFFLGSIWWLVHVTLIGWLLLCAYLGLFFACFGLLASRLSTVQRPPSTASLLLLPSVWVVLEYARSHLLSGFGWNLLAYSQTSWLPIIQIADITGAWGVSWLIVAMNTALADTLIAFEAQGSRDSLTRRSKVEGRRSKQTSLPPSTFHLPPLGRLACAMGLTAAVVAYGLWRMPQVGGGERVRVAVAQGNIPQEQKWDEAFAEAILERYERLTREAAVTQPDVIVWPETAVPGHLSDQWPGGPVAQWPAGGSDAALTQRLLALSRSVGVPLLVGAPRVHGQAGDWSLTNSAALLEEGAMRQWYDKLHLVPFGEFIPGERVFPWLRELLPPIGDFVPGHSSTVFTTAIRQAEWGSDPRGVRPLPVRTPHSALKFSVLICFEDVFPDLARRFVRAGARMLLVITNDAWFGPTAAAYQHAQASTFRAVELRVPVARAANTGWSGCIDAGGRWTSSVQDAAGRELFVEGTATCEWPVGSAGSVYGRWGDWFVLACVLVVMTWVGRVVRRSGAGETSSV